MPFYKVVVRRPYIKKSTGKTKHKSKELRFEAGSKDPSEIAMRMATRQWPLHKWEIVSLEAIQAPKKYIATVERFHCERHDLSIRTIEFTAKHDQDPWSRGHEVAMYRWSHHECEVIDLDEVQPDGTLKRLPRNYITVDWTTGEEVKGGVQSTGGEDGSVGGTGLDA